MIKHTITKPLMLLMLCALAGPLFGSGSVTLSLRDTDIAEVMDMLSRRERVNILLGKGVEGKVSLNMYEVSVDEAIESIANAAGYVLEKRDNNYFIVSAEDAGKYAGGITQLRTYKVQYSDLAQVEGIISNHLSAFGKSRTLEDRNLLVVEDTPAFLKRIERLLLALDQEPRQILIEARILEIQLDDSDAFGLDWKKLFDNDQGSGSIGVQGFAPGGSGLSFTLVAPHLELALSALRDRGRVRTLSTPKLLALENQEASVVIGDRIGYRVTTTINQVTTESIEFLESGVILRVTPRIDSRNRVMLDIHPEVSNGTLSGGTPNQTTTEVTTQVLVSDRQTIFIGGLIRQSESYSKLAVRGLEKIPVIGSLFGNQQSSVVNAETVVLITPHIIAPGDNRWLNPNTEKVDEAKDSINDRVKSLNEEFDKDSGNTGADASGELQTQYIEVPAVEAAQWAQASATAH